MVHSCHCLLLQISGTSYKFKHKQYSVLLFNNQPPTTSNQTNISTTRPSKDNGQRDRNRKPEAGGVPRQECDEGERVHGAEGGDGPEVPGLGGPPQHAHVGRRTARYSTLFDSLPHLKLSSFIFFLSCSVQAGEQKETRREYETLGYVLKGRAELLLEGQKLILEPGTRSIQGLPRC